MRDISLPCAAWCNAGGIEYDIGPYYSFQGSRYKVRGGGRAMTATLLLIGNIPATRG